ncbi:MAG TPA: PAS domain S-box protein [Longimicrobiaceae bacterium]|nr:PAS domain S-box protein [Longimicrobiaceae bacterium]
MTGEIGGGGGPGGAEERPTTLYQRLVEASPYGMFVLARSGHVVAANASFGRLLGVPPAHVLGRGLSEFIHAWDRQCAKLDLAELFRSPTPEHRAAYRVRDGLSGARVLHFTFVPAGTGGRVTGLHGVARDATAERSRERQHDLLLAALEHLDAAVSIFDESGGFLYTNEAHRRTFGGAGGAAPPERVQSLLPDAESRHAYEAGLDTVRREGRWSGVATRRRVSDGALLTVEVTCGIVRDGGEDCFFAVEREVADRIRQQEPRRPAGLRQQGRSRSAPHTG